MTAAARRRVPGRMTVEEFLAWTDDGSDGGWQLVDGEPRAMAPASATHGVIQATIAGLLVQHLNDIGGPYLALVRPAISPRVRAGINLRVPDLAVTCAPIAPGQIIVPDPVLVIEILSPSNEPATWDNVWAYASIQSVREILVVHSVRVRVELLSRQTDGSWPDDPARLDAAGTLELNSIGLTCPVAALYRGTHFAGGH